jgi:biotin carboxyl carrier protein
MIKTYKIKIENKIYEVEVEAITEKEGNILSTPEVLAPSKEVGENLNETVVEAPMQGVIIDILVKIGDTVEAGETLLTLEAMKMESAIVSPINGIISSISANKGETVNSGTVLMSIK